MPALEKINVASDFSRFPSGRYLDDGPDSGERFRESFLKPSLEEHERVEVFIEGTEGYGSSFLEEAFGGLIRKGYFSRDALHSKLEIKTRDDLYKSYIDEAWSYINDID